MSASKRDYEAVAERMARVRQDIRMIEAAVGLEGVSHAKGRASIEAVLDDMTRAVAFGFANENDRFDFDRFVAAADVAWLRSDGGLL